MRIPGSELPNKKDGEKKKVKVWPKEVTFAGTHEFKEKSFLTWTIERKKGKSFGIAIFSAILAVCLFPIWPYYLKLGVFYVCLYL